MEQYKITKPIRLIELFAGIGSQAKVLERLGVDFEHYKVCEFDKYAIASYNAIHNTNFTTSDITTLKGNDLEIKDKDRFTYLLTYSFPCQDLSLAGKQLGMKKNSGTRSGLLWEVERLLTESDELPQILLMENVPQVHSKKNIDDFYEWQKFLMSLGYDNYVKDLNAKDYGIPQNRNRCFMISLQKTNNIYKFPFPFELKLKLKDLLEDNVDEKYYLSDTQIQSIEKSNYIQNKRKIQEKTVCDTLCARDYKDPKCIKVYNPICLNSNGDGLRIRKLTPKECWRLMGFDDKDFEKAEKVNSNSQLYKQAGNSIVVNVLEQIFKQFF